MSAPANGTPDAAEIGRLRAFLARNRKGKPGHSQEWINKTIGMTPTGNRAEIFDDLKVALKALTKP